MNIICIASETYKFSCNLTEIYILKWEHISGRQVQVKTILYLDDAVHQVNTLLAECKTYSMIKINNQLFKSRK